MVLIYVDMLLHLTYIFRVNSIAERWVLAGKNIFNRWRSWRDPGAELLDRRVWLLPNSRLGLSRRDGVFVYSSATWQRAADEH